jgi:hypothetical protein
MYWFSLVIPEACIKMGVSSVEVPPQDAALALAIGTNVSEFIPEVVRHGN